MSFAYIVSGSGVITATIDSKTYTVDKTHPNYPQALKAIKVEDKEGFVKVADIPYAVAKISSGRVSVSDGQVWYNGADGGRFEIVNQLSHRILDQMAQGFKVNNLIKFLENLMQNPSSRAVNELYGFLENKGMPITEDGHFLAYKSVDKNYMDWHTGKVDNTPGGSPITMPRNMVDDNFGVACSQGYHVGNLNYVQSFGYGEKNVIIVKVNPKDVVSVPDSSVDKCRVCEYSVIADYVGPLPDLIVPSEYGGSGEYEDQEGRGDDDVLGDGYDWDDDVEDIYEEENDDDDYYEDDDDYEEENDQDDDEDIHHQ